MQPGISRAPERVQQRLVDPVEGMRRRIGGEAQELGDVGEEGQAADRKRGPVNDILLRSGAPP